MPRSQQTSIPAPAVGHSVAVFLWRVLTVIRWTKFFYCTNCMRPYCQSETKTGEFVVTQPNGTGTRAIYCVNCSKNLVSTRTLVAPLIIGIGALCFTVVCLFFAISTNDIVMWNVVKFCPWFGALFMWLFHREKSTYKPIYDHWVKQHGTDPDKWPDANKPK